MSQEKIIRLSKSSIGDAEKKAVMGVLDREYLGMGDEVQEFERSLTEYFGRPSVCVANGTAALQLGLQALGIGRGDEVLVQSLTYVASFQAITATGATPVPCDIDIKTFCIDINDAGRRLTKSTKAIMPVHYSGGVGDLNKIYHFARSNGISVIEDAAHAIGTTYENKLIGSFGELACFSFDGIKNITSGEGGCIVSSDEKLIQIIKDARLLGVENDSEMRYAGKRTWEFDVKNQGWRYHMSNIMAAIGIEQLKKISCHIKKRQELANQYVNKFSNLEYLSMIDRDYSTVAPHIFPILIPNNHNRHKFQAYLKDNLIQSGFHYQPNHVLSYFKSNYPLPVTDSVTNRLITLPLHMDLSPMDIDYISEKVINYFKQ